MQTLFVHDVLKPVTADSWTQYAFCICYLLQLHYLALVSTQLSRLVTQHFRPVPVHTYCACKFAHPVLKPACSAPSCQASCSSSILDSEGFRVCVLYVSGSLGAGHKKGFACGYQPRSEASSGGKVPGAAGCDCVAARRALMVSCKGRVNQQHNMWATHNTRCLGGDSYSARTKQCAALINCLP